MVKYTLITICFLFFALFIFGQANKTDTTKKKRFNIKFGIVIDTGYYNIKIPQKNIGFGKAKDSTLKDSLVDQILPYERLAKKKYTLLRRAYQNTVANYNYLFNAKEDLNNLLEQERSNFQDDPSELIEFYDYSIDEMSKKSIDSIIYRCSANILLHDLRNNRVDDSYFILAKAYFFHKNYDTAESLLQFINQSFFDQKNEDAYLIGSNTNGTSGISNIENERFFENKNIRNESLLWLARTYSEMGEYDKSIGILYLLKSDLNFPKRLYAHLNEQFAYSFYKKEDYGNCIKYLVNALPNAIDEKGRSRWKFLLGQLYEKVNQTDSAIFWYKKASEYSDNPKIIIYSIINQIKLKNGDLTAIKTELQYLSKKEKFSPYLPVIYLEVAKLALKIHDNENAKKWLVQSIKNNSKYDSEKQNALILLGDLTYNDNEFLIAKIAYDSILYINKNNSNYNKIQLRKQFLNKIYVNQINFNIKDSLENLYKNKNINYDAFVIRYKNYLQESFSLFDNKNNADTKIVNSPISNSNSTSPFNNNYKDVGKSEFIKKWGDRPNVDNWRRKSSLLSINLNLASQFANSNSTKEELSNKEITKESLFNIDFPAKIQTEIDYKFSIEQKKELLFKIAEDLLLKLNDYDKSSFYFKKILNLNEKDSISEKSIIYLASISLSNNNLTYRDSLINILTLQYPNGIYSTNKLRVDSKNLYQKRQIDDYKLAYFNSKIGNFKQFGEMIDKYDAVLSKSKFYIPFQFLKVKYYLQTKNDNLALKLLDSMIFNYQSEYIRDKSKNLIQIIKNRKSIEDYLTTLNLYNFDKQESVANTKDIDTSKNFNTIKFNLNTNEIHYIGLMFTNINLTFVKESINAINLYNSDFYKNLNLESTYAQFDDNVYLHWIGPFANKSESAIYLNKINLIIDKELLSFLKKTQYKLFQIGKSDILLINQPADLQLYLDDTKQ